MVFNVPLLVNGHKQHAFKKQRKNKSEEFKPDSFYGFQKAALCVDNPNASVKPRHNGHCAVEPAVRELLYRDELSLR